MGLSAGELDRRIQIQRATKARDTANDEVDVWADDFKLWASKRDRGPYETAAAQELIRAFDTVFEIRSSARARAIAPESHRIVYADRVFEIVGITEGKDRGDSLLLLASGSPDGRGDRGPGAISGE